jgi:hypothetical protein
LVSHQIAFQSQQRQRTVQAAYLAIADIVVCMLPGVLVQELGVSTSARSVVLSRVSQRHIMAKRRVAGDAQLAANRVHEAFADLRFQRLPQRRADTFELVGYVGSAERWLLVAVKLVPGTRAKTGSDEWWISTAYPLGRQTFRRLQSSGNLVSLV